MRQSRFRIYSGWPIRVAVLDSLASALDSWIICFYRVNGNFNVFRACLMHIYLSSLKRGSNRATLPTRRSRFGCAPSQRFRLNTDFSRFSTTTHIYPQK